MSKRTAAIGFIAFSVCNGELEEIIRHIKKQAHRLASEKVKNDIRRIIDYELRKYDFN